MPLHEFIQLCFTVVSCCHCRSVHSVAEIVHDIRHVICDSRKRLYIQGLLVCSCNQAVADGALPLRWSEAIVWVDHEPCSVRIVVVCHTSRTRRGRLHEEREAELLRDGRWRSAEDRVVLGYCSFFVSGCSARLSFQPNTRDCWGVVAGGDTLAGSFMGWPVLLLAQKAAIGGLLAGAAFRASSNTPGICTASIVWIRSRHSLMWRSEGTMAPRSWLQGVSDVVEWC